MWWGKDPILPDWNSRKAVGQWGEEVAALYLKNKGYIIVARHWTHRIGELDIVTRGKDGRIIFVEVKTRTSNRFGSPEDAIGPWKQERLRRTANVYMLKNRLQDVPYQIDSVAVIYDYALKQTTIRHLENVINADR
ncbi:MAG: hypothetical protein UX98_C0014G0012 [Parcubacteria group bacterium GW2011_GWA2_47_26]|nr:MAG: hypothetical protein UX98_C0014G0012 [Parcubacteria group bacterium GW2011_GWA2_47_26]